MKLSALVLTKNEEEIIGDCLKQLSFADEIIVLDQNSTDNTINIAKKFTKNVIIEEHPFDKARNILAERAKGDWLLYVDADERLSSELTQEIRSSIDDRRLTPVAYFFPRQNIILGKFLKHGGWWPDYVPRLFKKTQLIKWTGAVHESPQIEGEFGYLKSPLIHITARSMTSMLDKSAKWAKIEADLFFEKNSSKVTIPKVAKALSVEFISRYVLKRGFLDGFVGLIEAMYQAYHRAMVLTYLWELQNDAAGKFMKASGKNT